jgi:hypothetical protein
MDHDPAPDDAIDTSHPWLVIPLLHRRGPASRRPLSKITPPVISWLCPFIHVQGLHYATPAGTYLPDEPLEISVKVDNRGVPNAYVKLRIYWSDPATGFANPQLILSDSQPVAGRSVLGRRRFRLWCGHRSTSVFPRTSACLPMSVARRRSWIPAHRRQRP